MEIIIVGVFILGYLAIAFEHSLKVNKTASALLTGVACWTLFILASPMESVMNSTHMAQYVSSVHAKAGDAIVTLGENEVFRAYVVSELSDHLANISEILFFLMGAMTIVELIDAHQGFRIITDRIRTKDSRRLMWIVCWITFFLSAILDNLTTSIVMVSLIRKLIPDQKVRIFFAGLIIIAANAGGAWTPIGDVTTTMLWIGGQITALNIMKTLLIPSLMCMLGPLLFLTFTLKRDLGEYEMRSDEREEPIRGGKLMLFAGIAALMCVPVFKTYTHLPPYMGVLAGLGVLWVLSELTHADLDESEKRHYSAAGALGRIDVPSILFFLGILMAVGALESMLTLQHFATYLAETIGDNRIIIGLIGLLSAVVDNVPLVAASMGMYSMDIYPIDHMIWEFLAYCAGTGGSILIIGSAAGIAVMGMERIDFIWYLKKISLFALIGYLTGAATYLLLQPLLSHL
jgi:Na+/H+ antiporter NhaD/arsenite permease-like protein